MVDQLERPNVRDVHRAIEVQSEIRTVTLQHIWLAKVLKRRLENADTRIHLMVFSDVLGYLGVACSPENQRRAQPYVHGWKVPGHDTEFLDQRELKQLAKTDPGYFPETNRTYGIPSCSVCRAIQIEWRYQSLLNG